MRNDENGQPVPSGNIEGLSGLLSAVLTQTSTIQAADDAVDGKAHNLMAAALVVIALFATQLRNEAGEWQPWVIAAMVVHIVTVYLVMTLTRYQRYTGAVVDLATHREYFAKDSELLLMQLIEDADAANDANAQILRRKSRLLVRASGMFLFGFGIGAVSLFVIS